MGKLLEPRGWGWTIASPSQAATCPEDDAMARATSSADGEEMYEDKAGFGTARRTERSLQVKKGLTHKQGKISDQKQFRGDL